jgi:hypothetical protein
LRLWSGATGHGEIPDYAAARRIGMIAKTGLTAR